jgi:type II secretory pathway component PulJ
MERNNRGITLIEMLVYISIFVTVTNLAFSTFLTGVRNIKRVGLSLYEQQNLDAAVDMIRLDVTNADKFMEYTTGENCLVLSSFKDGRDCVIIYLSDGAYVTRLEGADDERPSRTNSIRLNAERFDFAIMQEGALEYVKADITAKRRIAHRQYRRFRFSFIEAPAGEMSQ